MTGAGFLPVWTATMAAMMLPSTVPLLRLDLMSWLWMSAIAPLIPLEKTTPVGAL